MADLTREQIAELREHWVHGCDCDPHAMCECCAAFDSRSMALLDMADDLLALKALAATGTVEALTALSPSDLAAWFALAIDESSRRKAAETELEALKAQTCETCKKGDVLVLTFGSDVPWCNEHMQPCDNFGSCGKWEER